MKKILYFTVLLFVSIILVSCGKTFTVTYVTNITDVTLDSQKVKENKTANKPDDLINDGYDFKGWFITSDFEGNPFVFTTKITKDITLYAKWEKIESNKVYYDITFDVDGNENVVSVLENTKLTFPTSPTKEGYDFIGWYLNDIIFDFNTLIEDSFTLYAKWTITKTIVTVTFEPNNDKEPIIINDIITGSLVNKPSNVTKADMYLIGWYDSDDLDGEPWDFENDTVTSELTLYAKWAKTYKDVAATPVRSTGNMRDNINNAESIGLDPNFFNVTSKKGSSNHVGVYAEIRIYKSGLLSFEINESFVIYKVKINFADTAGDVKVTLGNYTNTLSGYANKSFEIDNLDTTTLSLLHVHNDNTQVRIKSIEISYYQIGEDVIPEDDINRPEFDLNNALHILNIGDSFITPQELTVTDLEDGEIKASLNTNKPSIIDSNRIGVYYAHYIVTDSDSNTSEGYITIIFREPISTYYKDIIAPTTPTLYDLLNKSLNLESYGDSRYTLAVADRHPAKFESVYLIYDSAFTLGEWDGGNSWNREHVWAKSTFGGSMSTTKAENGDIGIVSDLHNLRASNPSVNSSHNNYQFAEDSTNSIPYGSVTIPQTLLNPHTPGKDTTYTTTGFYPGEEHKGDVARILFYMNTVWGSPFREDIEMLIRWHLEDPVDNFELIRNEVIFNHQGNRNPYIDNQDWVNIIYSN